MLQNAMNCPWCLKDLRGREILEQTQRYYENATNLTLALELWNVGYQCTECGCRWKYDGYLIRDGITELKDKYKTEEITEESVVAENTTTENDTNNNKNESEENSNE